MSNRLVITGGGVSKVPVSAVFNKDHVSLESALAEAALKNTPFSPDLSKAILALGGKQLYEAVFRNTRNMRNDVLHPEGSMLPSARRSRYSNESGSETISLTRSVSQRLTGMVARPSPRSVLNVLRSSWYRLISRLPHDAAVRMAHTLQVQCIPAVLAQHASKFMAMSFFLINGKSKRPRVETSLVDYADVHVSWMQTSKSHGAIPECYLAVGKLGFDWKKLGFRVDEVCRRDFASSPTYSGSDNTVKYSEVALLEQGIAMHSALEDVAATGVGVGMGFILPRAFVSVPQRDLPPMDRPERPENHLFVTEGGDVSQVFADTAVRLARAWFDLVPGEELPEKWNEPHPMAWASCIVQECKDQLVRPPENFDDLLDQLSQNMAGYKFFNSVWMSSVKRHKNSLLVPIDYMPLREAAGERMVLTKNLENLVRSNRLFAEMRHVHFGRDVWFGGELAYDGNLPSVQVALAD